MNINRRDTLKLFGLATIFPFSFLHQEKDITWDLKEDYKKLSKYWKIKTNIIPPTNHKEQYCILGKNTLLLKPINLPGEYKIKVTYIIQEEKNLDNLIRIIEYIWSLFYDKKEEDKIHEFNDKIYDYNIYTGWLQYVDIARDLSYCCHNMYCCAGNGCNCETKFFKENNHWSKLFNYTYHNPHCQEYIENHHNPEYSLKWLGFKNNLKMTSVTYKVESKKDFIIL